MFVDTFISGFYDKYRVQKFGVSNYLFLGRNKLILSFCKDVLNSKVKTYNDWCNG